MMAIHVDILNVVWVISLLSLIGNAGALPALPSPNLVTLLPSLSNHLHGGPNIVARSTPRIGTWTLLGCYDDSWVERSMYPITLIDSYGPDSLSTIDYCQSQCANKGSYVFAAVEKGNKCYCGYGDQVIADHLTAEKVDDKECNIPCEVDKSRACGGNTRVNLFKFVSDTATGFAVRSAASTQVVTTTVASAPITATTLTSTTGLNKTWTDLGCFLDDAYHPLLTHRVIYGSAILNSTECQKKCHDANFDLAGVEYSVMCFCDMSSTAGDFVIGGNSTQCNAMPSSCAGQGAEVCGELYNMQVYQFGAIYPARTSILAATVTSSATLIVATIPDKSSSALTAIATSSKTSADVITTMATVVFVTTTTTRTTTSSVIMAGAPTSPLYKPAIAASPTPSVAPMPDTNCGRTYTITKGDSCWLIWTRYNLTEAEFRILNPLLVFPECLIHPGDFVCIAAS